MSEYQLKPGKIGEKVIGVYQKIEDGVVGAYQKVENAFVDAFLEKTDEGKPEEKKADAEENVEQK